MKKITIVLCIFIAFKVIVFIAYLAYEHLPIQLIHFEHLAIEDIEFNDIYYSTRGHNDKIILKQKEVVLINTGSLPTDSLFRFRTANLIKKVSLYSPAAIGLDLLFEENKDHLTDSILNREILQTPNLVLAINMFAGPQIFTSKYQGIVNFPISQSHKETIREYYNYIVRGKDTIPSFALQLAKIKEPSLQASKSLEYLRYSCVYSGYYNILDKVKKHTSNNFPAMEASDILGNKDTTLFRRIIENKIVILGQLGKDSMYARFDVEDKYMVPTDSSLIHRQLLMPGAVIHANAIQAMINDESFTEMKGWRYELITGIILVLFLFLFYTIHHVFTLHKVINLLIIFASTIPIIFFLGPWLMSCGIYYHTGTLFLQIAFLEEFLEIAEGVNEKFHIWAK